MSTIIILLTIILFVIGCFGTLIPALPGIGLVYVGILLYAFADSFTNISITTVVSLGIVTLIASIAQYFGSMWAAKSAGGKNKALLGTFIGTILGAMIGPVGMFVGAFLGALAGALLEGNTAQGAARVALISVAGIIGASIIQLFLALVLIAAFVLAIFL